MTTNEPRVRYFFVGVGKCGTSWLYDFLKRHGLLSVPSIKEPYLVDQPEARRRRLERTLYADPGPAAEFSTLYFRDPDNPGKIRDYNPEARIVVTTRRPSDRIVSHFGFLRRRGQYTHQSLAEYLRDDPEELVERSVYAPVIERYRAEFGDRRVLVLPLEQLRNDPQTYVDRLLDFIGTERVTLDPEDTRPVLKAAAPRVPVAAYAAKRASDLLRRFGLLRLLGRLKSSPLVNSVLYRERRSEEKPTREFGDKESLIAELDADYARLLERCGVATPHGAASEPAIEGAAR